MAVFHRHGKQESHLQGDSRLLIFGGSHYSIGSTPGLYFHAWATRILMSMGQSLWDDIKIPGPQWDT